MPYRPFVLPLVLGTFLLVLGACEDPSNVGEDLVGGISGEPETLVLQATTFEPGTFQDVTGVSPRVLAGTVTDPIVGTISATGYVDFQAASTTGEFRSGTVASAELRLVPDDTYVYGDSTTAVTLRLRDFGQELSEAGVSSDTTLQPGNAVTEFTFMPTDSLVIVPLPQTWVTANDTTLRSTTFTSSFHGFILEPVSGNAVVAFDADQTQLRAVSAGQTVNFTVTNHTLYTTSRSGSLNLPPNTLLVQDGLGDAARLAFDFGDTLAATAINRAVVNLYPDTTTITATPPGFSRPVLRSVTLFVATSDELTYALDFVIEDGIYTLAGSGRARLALILQDLSLQRVGIDSIFVAAKEQSQTLNPILFHEIGVEDKTPNAVLTLTPID